MHKSLREQALDAASVPSEDASIRTFRSLTSTLDGAKWLEQAIDPMHDRGVASIGMPDSVSGLSVVQVINRRFTMTQPGGVAPDGKWDALVHFTPDLANLLLSPGAVLYDTPSRSEKGQRPQLHLTNATAVPYGGVVGQSGATGSTLVDKFGNVAAPWYNGTDLATEYSDFPSGGYRLVGGSLEVYNTTPELYRSGAVTCYRQSNRQELLRNAQLVGSDGSVIDNAAPAVSICPAPPNSVGAAQLIPSAVSHEAALGCYMPFVVNTDDVINYAQFGTTVYHNRADNVTTQSALLTYPISGTTDESTTRDKMGNWSLPHMCQPCGAYFTGLAPQTTLDVVCRFIIEVFPGVNDSVLLPLARPSPSHDAKALEAYRMLVNAMPVAVPVAWNGSGAWLKNVMQAAKPVAKFLAPVAKTLVKELPAGDILVKGVEAAGKAFASRPKKKEGKNKKV